MQHDSRMFQGLRFYMLWIPLASLTIVPKRTVVYLHGLRIRHCDTFTSFLKPRRSLDWSGRFHERKRDEAYSMLHEIHIDIRVIVLKVRFRAPQEFMKHRPGLWFLKNLYLLSVKAGFDRSPVSWVYQLKRSMNAKSEMSSTALETKTAHYVSTWGHAGDDNVM